MDEKKQDIYIGLGALKSAREKYCEGSHKKSGIYKYRRLMLSKAIQIVENMLGTLPQEAGEAYKNELHK